MKPRKPVKVTEEIHNFLSQNGKKGGETTRHLVELGKKAEAEENSDAEQ